MVIYYNVNSNEATCDILTAFEWLIDEGEVCFYDWLIENDFPSVMSEEDAENAREQFEQEVCEDIAWENWDSIKVIQLDDQEVKNYISLR